MDCRPGSRKFRQGVQKFRLFCFSHHILQRGEGFRTNIVSRPPSARQQIAIKMALRWWTDDGVIIWGWRWWGVWTPCSPSGLAHGLFKLTVNPMILHFINGIDAVESMLKLIIRSYTVNLALVRTAKNNYFSLCTNY